jgi:hypothetical protein
MESQLSTANEEGIKRDPTQSEHWHRAEDKPASREVGPERKSDKLTPVDKELLNADLGTESIAQETRAIGAKVDLMQRGDTIAKNTP